MSESAILAMASATTTPTSTTNAASTASPGNGRGVVLAMRAWSNRLLSSLGFVPRNLIQNAARAYVARTGLCHPLA